MEIMRVGLDFAKNVFEVFAVDNQEKEAANSTHKCDTTYAI
jgi:hypothetical protein